MKQNVLIVHNHYQLTGGEANVAANETRLLIEHGHDVTTYARDNAEIAGYGLLQKLRLPFTTLFSLQTYRAVRQIIRQKQIDVVHVHNTVPLVSPAVYYAAWSCGVPVVQTVHNYRFVCPSGMCFRDGQVCEACLQKSLLCAVRYGCYRGSRAQSAALSASIALHRLLGTYRRIEAYICLTPFMLEKLASKLPQERLAVKPNIVDVPLSPVPYEAHDDAFVFFGRLDKQKGVWILLQAFERLPEFRLILIGSGPEEAGMRAYLAEHAMQNVAMTGALPHDEALSTVARAKAFVMPTQWYEGLPLTVLESFALGTPVIGSKLGNVGALLSQWGGGAAFDQTSPEALADCIRSLAPSALAAWSKQARTAADALCNREENYRALIRIYEEAASRRKALK